MSKVIPINVDRNVGPGYYRELAEAGRLLVTSVFYTIQGEGPFAGQPAVFVRLAGCNIGGKEDCPFCDTYFAVDMGMPVTVEALLDEIGRLWPGGYNASRSPLVVITGGEPLLQWPMLRRLMKAGPSHGITWQIETNGMYLRGEEHLDVEAAVWVVSPKIPHGRDRYTPFRSELFVGYRADDLHFKFVVTADETSPYHRLPLQELFAHGVAADHVYVSGMTDYTGTAPAGPDKAVNLLTEFTQVARATTAANWGYAAKLALQHGFNLSLQTHLLAGVQ